MAQTLFNRTVGFHLPSAIPTHLERIDEFALGKVLIHTKKPKRFTPWRKHELSFTGWSISSLLSQPEDQKIKIATASSFLFDLGKGSSSATVQVNLDADLNLHDALVSLDAKLKVGEQKKLNITTDLGKVTHVSTDLLNSFVGGKIRVNMDHAIVREAMDKGGTIFVITSMYTAEHCNIQVSISDSEDESVEAKASASAAAGGEGGESVKRSDTATQVINRSEPTPIAYLLLRLEVGRHGELRPHLNTHLKNVKNTFEVLNRLGAFPAPTQAKTVRVPPKFKTQNSQDFQDWIIIDIVEETTTAGDTVSKATAGSSSKPRVEKVVEEEEPLPSEPEASHGQGGEAADTKVEEVVAKKVTSDLGALPPAKAQVKTPYATPMSEIVGSGAAAKDEPDSPLIDQHYVYSLRDFQPFESGTYQGILGEVQEWVEPVVTNQPLRSAFLQYIQPPRTLEKLKALTAFLLEYGNALRTHRQVPANTNKDFDPILSHLSGDVKVKLDEVTSLIVTSEAMDEFPQFLVKKAIELPDDKRKTLIDFICQTPYGTDKHVYTDVGPYNDPDLYPLMTKMGFSLPSAEHHLIFSSGEDSPEDILAAGLIMLEATKQSPS